MSEVTEEQLAQLEQQIIARQQWLIAADQFFREGLFAAAQKVNQGLYDPFILDVGKQLYKGFKDQNTGSSNESK